MTHNFVSSSTTSSSPPPNELPSVTPSTAASTAATSPPPHDESDEDTNEPVSDKVKELQNEDEDKRYARLQYVLEKSAIYSQILKQRMDQDKERVKAAAASKAAKAAAAASSKTKMRGGKRLRVAESDDEDEARNKKLKKEDGEAATGEDPEDLVFQQPALVTGAKLKSYQLEGLQWMVSLDQNGISGILADEMGLGKTLQTISFSAYLREQGNTKPFLVVCPLSVLHNWISEYEKFAPKIPVCMYHGHPEHRAELRSTVMLPIEQRAAQYAQATPKKRKPGRPANKGKKGRLTKSNANTDVEELEDQDGDSYSAALKRAAAEFPVVVTTYEIIIRDRPHLAHYNWGYIVVDEGHRLKNLECKLMQEIKKYTSAGRMILTGTPLHNNLAELWSLLNFVLPDIFNDVDAFQEWFNLPSMQSTLGSERSSQIIGSLHAILKPFLLRRLKSDVEANLPPKKEYVLYAPLSMQQREAYNRVLDGTIRQYLIGEEYRRGDDPDTGKVVTEARSDEELLAEKKPKKSGKAKDREVIVLSSDSESDEPLAAKSSSKNKNKNTSPRKPVTRRALRNRGAKRRIYNVDGSDDEYFARLENGEIDEYGRTKKELEAEEKEKEIGLKELARQHQRKAVVTKVNNMKLQNTVMQLRKVCSHPFLFDWPVNPETREYILDDQLVNASGKMMVLDRLLRELFKRKHKVLIFSQFTTMLDIIEEWATEFMGWNLCRIDGSSAPMERRQEMERFQTGGDSPNAPNLFLLSTRAGGLGINLVAADTVIFYDQDWNPQMDAQAQDRAHRIGQTKPVLIFRLVSAHTIETKIMQRATEKRQLEALVIAKGKFKAPATANANRKMTMAEMAAALLRLEGEKIDVVPNTAEGKASVLSDEDLEILLDRRPEVFAHRGKGWTSHRADANGKAVKKQEEDGKEEVVEEEEEEEVHKAVGKKAAFAVYEAPKDETSDALAKMLGEDVE